MLRRSTARAQNTYTIYLKRRLIRKRGIFMRNLIRTIYRELAECAEMIDLVVSKGNL